MTIQTALPQTMKGMMIHAYNSAYKLATNLPVPTPAANQLLVRITASSLCMSDVMGIRGYTQSPLPYCGGHEPVGVVAAVGPGVRAFHLGDRVGFMPASNTCQACPQCLRGNHRYCAEKVSVGFAGPCGGFSQYCLADVLSTAPVPDALSDADAAPLFCAGVTAYGAVKKAAQRQVGGPDALINIVGAGGVGHLAIQYAKAMGFRVHAFDVSADKLALATASGADAVFDSVQTPAADVAQAASTIVVSGAIPAYAYAMDITATCGAVIAVGAPHEPVPVNVTGMVLRELSLLATNQGTKLELSEAIQLAAAAGIKPVIQKRHITDINAAVDDMLAGKVAGRIVFDMW